MEIIKTNIEGVVIIEPRIFKDDRGYFLSLIHICISRIKSLLSMFNLDNRIVDTKQQINLILNDSINWESVEWILVQQRKKSMQFLITNLDE